MYSNFRDEHKGAALKNLVWKIARATKVSTFEADMLEIKTIKESAYKWLCDKPTARWSRSHFNTLCKFDILPNNIYYKVQSYKDLLLCWLNSDTKQIK